MIFKLSVLAALVAPFVSALSVSQPSQAVNNGGSMTFTWTAESGDPATFSVYLQNPTFNNVYGVANNVDASAGTLTIQVPQVPDNEQYTVILVPIDNVNQVLAQSPPFNIGPDPATTGASSTPSATGTTRSVTSPSASSPTATRPPNTSTSPSFGTTVSNTGTTGTTGNTGAPAETTSPNAASPVRFNMNMGVVASMALSLFAGAAAIAL